MTDEEKDRYIVEKTGGCWHVFEEYPHGEDIGGYGYYTNPNCSRDWYGKNRRCIEITRMIADRPSFATPAGRIALLKIMMKREDWERFRMYLYLNYYEPYISVDTAFGRLIIDDAGKFRDAVYEWLRND